MTDKPTFEALLDEALNEYRTEGEFKRCKRAAVLAAYYAGWEGQPNQCDGCVAGTPVRDGLHRDEQGRGYMTCQRERYTHPAPKADGRTVVVPAEELAQLRAEVEKYRGGIHTHGPDCWSWGWRHYECAEREIARLRAHAAELERDAGQEPAKSEPRCGSCGWPYPCECGFMPKPKVQQVAVGLLRAVEKARGGTAPKEPMCMPGTLKIAGPCPRCKGEGWTDEGDPEIGSAPFECDWCLGTQKEHTCGQQASCAPCEERDRRADARANEAQR